MGGHFNSLINTHAAVGKLVGLSSLKNDPIKLFDSFSSRSLAKHPVGFFSASVPICIKRGQEQVPLASDAV